MSTNSKITVIDVSSEKILFECHIDDSEQAFAFAAQMEEMGLEVSVIAPTITQSLCHSLGLDPESQEDYEESVVAELEDHDGSCCHKMEEDSKKGPLQ